MEEMREREKEGIEMKRERVRGGRERGGDEEEEKGRERERKSHLPVAVPSSVDNVTTIFCIISPSTTRAITLTDSPSLTV